MDKALPLYQVKIDEDDDETGVFLVSFVDKPAMQVQGIALAEEKAPVAVKLEAEQEEMTMTSAVIIPDKLIYRKNPERNIVFTAEDTKKMRNKFMRLTGKLRLSNKNHVEDDIVDAYLTESWIIKDSAKDKAAALGFDLPVGTWMATYQVKDRKFWDEEVKTGNVTGFSLEGMFQEIETQLTLTENLEDEIDAAITYLTSLLGT
jgi:hypothetical protein